MSFKISSDLKEKQLMFYIQFYSFWNADSKFFFDKDLIYSPGDI